MSKVKFAIIGSGSIANTHAQAISAIDNATLVAIYGRSADKVKDLATQYNCDWYTDLDVMLKRADIDAVSICTPNGTHANMGIAAALAGKHVLVEKPIDVSLEKADALIAFCQTQGVKLGVIFQRRYSEGVVALKQLLAEKKLGQLLFGGCYFKLYRSQEYYDSAVWRGTWDVDGGGVLMNQGIHYIDMLQFLMGPVAEVTARCGTFGHVDIEVEDTAASAIMFKSGALGVIEGTTCAYPGLVSRVDIYGTEGTAIIENDILTSVKLKSGYVYNEGSNTDNAGVSSPAISSDFHLRQFEDMVRAIQTDTEPSVPGKEGRKSLEIILSIYEAAFTGERVLLPLSNSVFLSELAEIGGFCTKNWK